jgi:hypothetical protein
MSIRDDNGALTPSEWWKEVKLSDVAGCKATVERFVSVPGAIDNSEYCKALPLFILCGGDLTRLVKSIKNEIDSAYEAVLADLDKTAAFDRLKRMSARQDAICAGLCPERLPESYREDVSKARAIVGVDLTRQRLAKLKIMAPPKVILKRTPKV